MTLIASLNPQFGLKDNLEEEGTNQRIDKWSMYDKNYSLVRYEENEVTEVKERPNL